MPWPIDALLAMLTLSAFGGWWWASKNSSETAIRWMLFIGYFWLLTFLQIVMTVLVYVGWQHFMA